MIFSKEKLRGVVCCQLAVKVSLCVKCFGVLVVLVVVVVVGRVMFLLYFLSVAHTCERQLRVKVEALNETCHGVIPCLMS